MRTYTVAAAAGHGYAGGQYSTQVSAGLLGGTVELAALGSRQPGENIFRVTAALRYGLAGDNMPDAMFSRLSCALRDYTAAAYTAYGMRLNSAYGLTEQVEILSTFPPGWTDAGLGFWPSGDSPNLACFDMIVDLERQIYMQASLNGVNVGLTMPLAPYVAAPVPALNGQVQLAIYNELGNDGLMHTFYVGDASVESLSL